jgi:glycosyltransferase involved in cell wall biosynthesis
MRIVQLTGGTGSFYCGTCMRDNALVVELRRQGHDASLVPLYLPLTLDEANATPDAPHFFGGVNVYLQQKSALFRHTPRWVDRLFDAPGLLRAAGRRAGVTQARELGDLTLSMLRGEEGRQVKELDRLTDWLAGEARPGMVCLSYVLLIGLARRIKERTGATILCFLNGEDGFLDALPEPERQAAWDEIAARAADVDCFLPVSHYYADLMTRRARLPADRVRVVYPGLLLEGYPAGSERPTTGDGSGPALPANPVATPRAPTLGYLARMHPSKGLETLVDAYLILRERNRLPGLRLRVAGSCTDADAPFVEHLTGRLQRAGTLGEVEFRPNLDRNEKIDFLRGLSVFSVPATYGEAFGLYVIEAMAAGTPVVQPRHAAFPEILAATGGGTLCEPHDPAALADAVEALLTDPERARALGEQGRRAVHEKFGVERMAREVLAAAGRDGLISHAGIAGVAGGSGRSGLP